MPNFLKVRKNFNKKGRFLLLVFGFLFVSVFLFAEVIDVKAQDIDPTQSGFGLEDEGFSQVAVSSQRDIKDTIAQIINIALGFLGVVAVILILYAGYLWTTARGNEDQVKKAKILLRNAVIGLVIIFSSWAIATFIINRLQDATGNNGQNSDNGSGGGGGGGFGAPGAFVIKSFKTANGSGDDSIDVYTCSSIQTQFNHWLSRASFEAALLGGNLTVVRYVGGDYNTGAPTDVTPQVNSSLRNNVITFTKTDGDNDNPARVNWTDNSFFEARLSKNLTDTDSLPISNCSSCDGSTSDYWFWRFQTGLSGDSESPQIASHFPESGQTDAPRSSIFTLNFSEAVLAETIVNEEGVINSNNIILEELDGPGGNVVDSFVNFPESFDLTIEGNTVAFALNKDYAADFDGKSLLEPLTWYRLTARSIQDLCGNGLSENSFEFRTSGETPGVSFVRPSEGYEHACPNTEVFVRFKTSMYDIATQSCAVGVGLVESGNLVPSQGGASVNLLPLPNDDYYEDDLATPKQGTPNDYCREYHFNNTNLLPNAQYSAQVNFKDASAGASEQKGWAFKVADAGQCASEPFISSLSPARGAWSRCLTISGRNFTNTAGNVSASLSLSSARNNTPNGLSQSIVDFWEDGAGAFGFLVDSVGLWSDKVITADSGNLTQGPSADFLKNSGAPTDGSIISDIDTEIVVTVDHGGVIGELSSNPAKFYINESLIYDGPCLDSVSPNSAAWGEDVNFVGRNLGDGTDTFVEFSQNKNQTSLTSWTNTGGSANVPANAQDGDVKVVVGGVSSNPLPFDVSQGVGASCSSLANSCSPNNSACSPGLQCSSDCTCQRSVDFSIDDFYPNNQCSNQNCLNSLIGFNTDSGINVPDLDNIDVYKCSTQNCTTEELTNDIVLNLDLVDSQKVNISISDISAGAYYRVIVFGRDNGLHSENGGMLSNLNYDFNNNGELDSFSWIFQLSDNSCQINRIEIDPTVVFLRSGQNSDFTTNAYSAPSSCYPQGQILNLDGEIDWAGYKREQGSSGQSQCFAGVVEDKIALTPSPDGNTAQASAATFLSGETDTVLAWVCARHNDKIAAAEISVSPACSSNADCAQGGMCGGSVCINSGSSTGSCSPIIKSFEPQSGNFGTWATIKGCYFGNTWGEVTFGGASALKPNFNQCGNTWGDRQIVAEVPPDAASGVIEVTTKEGQTTDTNNLVINNFTIDSSEHPAICKIQPGQARVGSIIDIKGKNFNLLSDFESRLNPGEDNSSYAVIFENLENPPQSVSTDSVVTTPGCPDGGWSDNEICIRVANQSGTGEGNVRVRVASNQSAGYNFKVIDSDQIPDNAKNIQAVSFSPGSAEQACPNIVLEVNLSTLLDEVSMDNNLIIRKKGGAEVSGDISFSNIGSRTTLRFYPDTDLDVGSDYEIVLKGGVSGLRSKTLGVVEESVFCNSLSGGDCVIEFETVDSLGQAQCVVNSLDIEPNNSVFFCGGKDNCQGDTNLSLSGHQRLFTALPKNRARQTVTTLAPVSWTSSDGSVILLSDSGNSLAQEFSILPKNGQSLIRATINNTSITGSSVIKVSLCENPWIGTSDPYLDFVYHEPLTNFATFYCRDRGDSGFGDDLPALNDPIDSSSRTGVAGLVKEQFFVQPVGSKTCSQNPQQQCRINSDCGQGGQCVGSSDAIGVRVIGNSNNYSAQEWYNLQSFSRESAQTIIIDGYQAIKDGNTYYISASNDTNPSSSVDPIYTNIYVVSVNEDSHQDTKNIFSQIINNFVLSANVSNSDDKDKIRNDSKRLSDARFIADLLLRSSSLPSLVSGTFEKGISLSVWPSWKQTLSSFMGTQLPSDPINEINCASSPSLDQDTCWDPSPANAYVCEADTLDKKSRFYSYQFDEANAEIKVGFNLEYKPQARSYADSRFSKISDNVCKNLEYSR